MVSQTRPDWLKQWPQDRTGQFPEVSGQADKQLVPLLWLRKAEKNVLPSKGFILVPGALPQYGQVCEEVGYMMGTGS